MVRLELARGLTALWTLEIGGGLPEESAAALPSWRRERLARLKNENARRESLAAGLLYAYAMRRAGLDPDAPVRLLPAGKPVREDIWFSLSHSGRWALCAVSAAPVGADVQERRPTRISLARRFHPDERAWLEALSPAERSDALLCLWTRKEAWVKAVSGERFRSLSETDVREDLPGLAFRDYILSDGSPAALCGEAPLPEAVRYVPESELFS